MKSKKKKLPDLNAAKTTLEDFAEYYNKNIPAIFPRVSVKALQKFRETHASLFKESNDWTINKHRKKLMDWLSSYNEEN